jgi:hypothetical protein
LRTALINGTPVWSKKLSNAIVYNINFFRLVYYCWQNTTVAGSISMGYNPN